MALGKDKHVEVILLCGGHSQQVVVKVDGHIEHFL
jgi:hypothetical protein